MLHHHQWSFDLLFIFLHLNCLLLIFLSFLGRFLDSIWSLSKASQKMAIWTDHTHEFLGRPTKPYFEMQFCQTKTKFYLRDLKKWLPRSASGERSDRKKWAVVRRPRGNSSSSSWGLLGCKADRRKIRCKSLEPRRVRKKWAERSARIKWSSLLLLNDLRKWPEIIIWWVKWNKFRPLPLTILRWNWICSGHQ